MKNPITISACLVPVSLYLVIAFSEWDANIAHWTPPQRAFIGVGCLIGAVFWALVTADDERQRDFNKARLQRKSGPPHAANSAQQDMAVLSTAIKDSKSIVFVGGQDGSIIILGRFPSHEIAQGVVAVVSAQIFDNAVQP